MTGTPWFKSVQSELGVRGSWAWCVIISRQHIFCTPGGTRNIKMSTNGKAEVSEQNQIPIDKEKLKEEHKVELKAITDAFE